MSKEQRDGVGGGVDGGWWPDGMLADVGRGVSMRVTQSHGPAGTPQFCCVRGAAGGQGSTEAAEGAGRRMCRLKGRGLRPAAGCMGARHRGRSNHAQQLDCCTRQQVVGQLLRTDMAFRHGATPRPAGHLRANQHGGRVVSERDGA